MKKVAIIGYTSTREMAPWDDPEYEIWGMNDLYQYPDVKRFNRWFQLHTEAEIERCAKEAGRGSATRGWEQQVEDFKKMGCPVYMQKKHKRIPNSVRYPLKEIVKHFSQFFVAPFHAQYFTNTVSYMVALAIAEDFKEIHIYGIDMAVGSEYDQQRPSCEFWLGVAVGRGIKVHIPLQSDLLKARFMYGYEDEEKHAFDMRLEQYRIDIEAKKNEWVQQLETAKAMVNQYTGAEQTRQEIKRIWS